MKRKTKRRYCYLLERKTDEKHFCAFGNFKATSYGQHPCVLFDLLPETYLAIYVAMVSIKNNTTFYSSK